MLLTALMVPIGARAQNECDPIEVSSSAAFTEGFNGSSLPACWTTSGNGTWSVGVGDYSSSTGTSEGAGNAMITHGSSGDSTMLISPVLDLSALSNAELTFYYVMRSWSGDVDELHVYYRNDLSATWTELQAYTEAAATWTEVTLTLPSLSSTYQLAFVFVDHYGYGVGLDNITVGAPPSCLRPSGLQALVNGNDVTFNWTDASATAWDIVWGPTGFSIDTVTVNTDVATTTSYQAMGLSTGMWQAYVRANCGSETSAWLGPVNFGVGIYNMTVSGTDTLRTCNTVIYDNGGSTGNYAAYCNSTLVLLPSEENSILKISGTSYTEGSWDYLTIYDGIGTSGEILFQDNVSGVSSSVVIPELRSSAFTINFHSDSGTEYDGFEINVTCEDAPTCMRPESLTIDSVGTTWVALSWEDENGSSWAVEYGPAGFDPSNTSNPNVHFVDFTTTDGTITGLNAGTKYDFYLMTVCGSNEGDTSWTLRTSTYTLCDVISVLPYQENFEGLATGSDAEFNPCITKGNNFYSYYPYTYNSSYMDAPSNFLYFYTSIYSGSNPVEWVVLPTVSDDIEMNTLELSFNAYALYAGTGYGHDLLVGIIDTNVYSDTANITIDTIATFNVTTSETKYISLADYEGSGKNIILLHWLNGDSYYGYLGIDDIDLHLLPLCDRPDSLSLTAADSTQLTLGWWASENSSSFLVEWRNADSTNAAYSSAEASENSYTIENLTPNTLYDVRVSTLCGDDTSIAVVGQFRTQCVEVSEFPYNEDFETNSHLCWLARSFDGYDDNNWTRSDNYAHSGSYSYYSSYSSSSVGTDWLVSPAIVIPDDMDAAQLSWYVSGGAYYGIMPHYAVKISSTSSVDTTTFTTVLEEDRDDYDNTTYTYNFVKRSVDLSQYAGQTIYIAFVRHARDDSGFMIDDISISQTEVPEVALTGSASPIVGLAATYVAHLDGGQSAGLTWSWNSVRATAGTATMTTVSADTITMLYTSADVDTLRLIGTNTFGSDTAYLVINPVSISYATLPYSTGFEPTDDRSWTISNGSNGWYIDTAARFTGSYGLYVSADSGATNGYNTSSTSASFAYKAFSFPAGQYGISFDWLANGEDCCDYIQAYLVPASDSSMVGSDGYFYAPGTWRSLGDRLNSSSQWQSGSIVFDVDVPSVYYICLMWRNDGSVGSNPAGALDNFAIAQITCPAPTALTFDSITSTTARFHWTPTGNETSWQVKVGALAPVTVTDTFYTATGLTPATNYNVVVRGICGVGDTSLALSGSFWTECVAFNVPYYIHFDGYNGLNVCWNNQAVGGTTPSSSWSNTSTYGYEYIYSSASSLNNPTSDYLISPAIQIPTDTAALRLVLQVAGLPSTYYSSSVAAYQVLVSPNGSDSVAAFTDVLLQDTINTSTFEYRRMPLAAYAGQTIRFAIRNISRMSGSVYLYDAGVRYVNQPMYYVSGNTTVFTGDTNRYIATREEGDTNGMTLTWYSRMATAGQATILNNGTDTMYIVYTAGGTDSLSFIAANSHGADTITWLNDVHQCGTITEFPWTVDFENSGDIACWRQEGDAQWQIGTGDNSTSTGAHSGTGNALITHTDRGNTTKLITPVLDLSGASSATLTFWHIQRVWAGDQDELHIYYRTSQSAEWNLLTSYTSDIATWTFDSLTLPNTTATYQVAFEMVDGYGYGVALDDITISGAAAPACDAPVNVVASADETTATVNFISEVGNYEVAIAEQWDEATVTPIAITDTFYTFTGLTAATQYTIGVRTVCSATNMSDWVLATVTTDQHPCATPSALTVTDVTLTSATLGWTIGEAETQWELHVTGTNYDETFTVTTNPYTLTGLTPAVTYSFTVSAICSETQTSEPSEAQTFTTESCQPVSGVNVSDITTTTATVTWTAPAGVTAFEVEYGASGFNQGAGTTVQASTNSASITGLTSNMAYDVYVRSVCAEGIYSAWSSVNTFTTDEETEGIDDVNSAAIALYPNPATTTVTISGIEGQATVTVVDMNGREVHTQAIKHSSNQTITLDLTGYAQGAYFVRITGEQQNAIRKLIVK